MNEMYERQIEEVARGIPEGPCLVALVPTIVADQAAALAGDLAQQIARGRPGHTLLVSLEDPPAALDHEIGVEGGPGLTAILAGRATVAGVAAHGRARGYVYVPAGDEAAPGRALARSPAFRSLCESAVRRGATVLAFAPAATLPGDAPPFAAGIVWLGAPAPGTAPEGWQMLGSLRPPSGPGVPEAAGSDTDAEPGPTGLGASAQASRRRRDRRRGNLFVIVLAAIVLGGLALTAYALLRPRPPEPFLPQNDSLWRSPR
jgi:hypothetical protein